MNKSKLNKFEMIAYLDTICPWAGDESKSAILNNLFYENDKFELKKIRLDSKKMKNSSYFKPHSKRNLKKYIKLKKEGNQAPPIVLKENDNSYDIIDGNHRIHAYINLKEEYILAYVLVN